LSIALEIVIPLDSYLLILQLNDFNNVYRAKTPSPQRKIFSYILQTWRALRLCAGHLFPDSVIQNSTKNLNIFGQALSWIVPPKLGPAIWLSQPY